MILAVLCALGGCLLSLCMIVHAKCQHGVANHQERKNGDLHLDPSERWWCSGSKKNILSAGTASRSITGPSSIPPTITVANGRCTWLPMPVEIAAGNRPIQAERAVISSGRIRVEAARYIASSGSRPWDFSWL